MVMSAKQEKVEASQGEFQDFQRNIFREIVEILMYGLSLLIFCKGFVWQNFQIPTPSMENTLLIGDHITANTMIFRNASAIEKKLFPFRDIKRGDIVVFKFPGGVRDDYIKRCIGVPGDRLEIISDRVYVNPDEPLQEQYTYYKKPMYSGTDRDPDNRYFPLGYHETEPGLEHAEYPPNQNFKVSTIRSKTLRSLARHKKYDPETYHRLVERLKSTEPGIIPEGFYFMMGDNRNRSYDSRSWGLVPKEYVQGKAFFRWWSYGEDEDSHKLKGWDLIWSYLRVPFTFWTRTHWEESFTFIK